MTRIVIEIEPSTARLLVDLAIALGALEVVEEPAVPFVPECSGCDGDGCGAPCQDGEAAP